MSRTIRRTTTNTAAIVVTACMAVAANAQEAPPGGSATPQRPAAIAGQDPVADDGGLADIIVTAQRREENLQKAAVAVSAVSGSDLLDKGISDPSQLTALVPALQVSTAAGPYSLFYLRGVGNLNANSLSDSAIAFNVDGVFVSRPSGTTGFFYDIERVEVLKGPQGTLYGRNATGGAINVITRKPRLGALEGDFSASYGNFDAVQLNGAVNVPVGEDTAVRVAGQYVRHGAYMSDGSSDQEDLSTRIQLKTRIGERITATIGADYTYQNGVGAGATILTDDISDRRVGVNDPRSIAAYNSNYFFPAGNVLQPPTNNPSLNNRFYGVSATIDADLDFATLTLVPAYRKGELDIISNAAGFRVQERSDNEQFTMEARLASGTGKTIEWLLGAFYINEKIDAKDGVYNLGFSTSFQAYKPRTESAAAFGRVTLNLTDTFRATGGIRYTYEKKELTGSLQSATVLCGGTVLVAPGTIPVNCFGAPLAPDSFSAVPPPNGIPVPFGFGSPFPGGPATTPSFLVSSIIVNDDRATFNKVTWRAGLEYDIADRSLLYASYETGFKSGGFFFTNDDPVYQPEEITAWTIGSKNRFFDNRLQLNLEAFYWTYSDQQITGLSRDSTNTPVLRTRNVGRSINKGVEVEALGRPARNTQLSVNVQYLDAKYDSFVFDTPNSSLPGVVVPPTTNCPFTGSFPDPVYIQDCSGKRSPNAPEWVVAFGGEQTVELGSYKLVLSGSTRYQSSIFTGLEYLDSQIQRGYWRSDASLTLGDATDSYFVTAFVNNIENEDIVSNSIAHPFAGAALVFGTVRPPRTYGIRAGVRF